MTAFKPPVEEGSRIRLWGRLYSALSATEVLSVCRQGPFLNARGVRILGYLKRRNARCLH